MIKWNKKICIQHITELKDPFEQQNSNGNQPRLSQIAQRFRQTITGTKKEG